VLRSVGLFSRSALVTKVVGVFVFGTPLHLTAGAVDVNYQTALNDWSASVARRRC
jgi:hypothetical protein